LFNYVQKQYKDTCQQKVLRFEASQRPARMQKNVDVFNKCLRSACILSSDGWNTDIVHCQRNRYLMEFIGNFTTRRRRL